MRIHTYWAHRVKSQQPSCYKTIIGRVSVRGLGVEGGLLFGGGVLSFEMCIASMRVLVGSPLVFKFASAHFVLLRLWFSRGL